MKAITRFFQLACFLLCITSIQAQTKEAAEAFNQGLKFYQAGNYEAALPHFQNALNEDPNFMNAYRAIISAYEQTHQLHQAIQYYHKALEITPSDARMTYNLALTYRDNGQEERAITYLKKALEINPSYANAYSELQRLEKKQNPQKQEVITVSAADKNYNESLKAYRSGAYNEALQLLKQTETEADEADYFYLMGIINEALHETAEAIIYYEQTLERDDLHFDANVNLGRLYYNQQTYDAATNHLEIAHKQRQKDKALSYTLAKSYLFSNAFKEAIPLLEEYTNYDRQDADAYYYLGQAYEATNQKRKADKAFTRARELGGSVNEPTEITNACGREANTYAQAGNYKQAIETLENCLVKVGDQAAIYFNLGLFYEKEGNLKKAKAAFKKTVKTDGAHAKAYVALGNLYFDEGDFVKAGGYYKEGIDAGRRTPIAYAKLASCYFRLKNYEAAAEAYKSALELRPDDTHLTMNLGKSYLFGEEFEQAIQVFKRIPNYNTRYLDAQYNIGISLVKMNRFKEGLEVGKAMVERDPNYALGYLTMSVCYKGMRQYGLAEEYEKKATDIDPSILKQ